MFYMLPGLLRLRLPSNFADQSGYQDEKYTFHLGNSLAVQKPVIKMTEELILNTKGLWVYFMFAIGQGSHFLSATP